jgi:hypothetical protein
LAEKLETHLPGEEALLQDCAGEMASDDDDAAAQQATANFTMIDPFWFPLQQHQQPEAVPLPPLPQQRQQPLLPRAAYYCTPCASFEPDSELASSGSSGSTVLSDGSPFGDGGGGGSGFREGSGSSSDGGESSGSLAGDSSGDDRGGLSSSSMAFRSSSSSSNEKKRPFEEIAQYGGEAVGPSAFVDPQSADLKGAPPEAGLSNTAAAAAVLSVPPQPELFPKGGKAEGEPEQEAAGQQQQQQQQQQQRRRQAGFAAVVLAQPDVPTMAPMARYLEEGEEEEEEEEEEQQLQHRGACRGGSEAGAALLNAVPTTVEELLLGDGAMVRQLTDQCGRCLFCPPKVRL